MIGAGGVGQFVVQGARIAGAAEILVVDPVEGRRGQALALGATRACAPDEVREAMQELDPEGVDYAFDAVGAPATTKLALRWTRGGGTAVVVGLPAGGEKLELDPFEFSNREKTLTGTIYGSEDPAVALPRLLELVRRASSSLRAWSARRSRSTAQTTLSARASRASPAACSSHRRIVAVDFGDNVWDVDWDEPSAYEAEAERAGYRGVRGKRLRRQPGASLSAAVWELEPGATQAPYHFHHGGEELLIVLRGTPTLRSPEGERELREGDVVALPAAARKGRISC